MAVFRACGDIKRVIMGHFKFNSLGLDRFQKTPCGFCFVEYYHGAVGRIWCLGCFGLHEIY